MASDGITINRGPFKPALVFDGPEDVLAFLDREKDFWAWTEGKEFGTSDGRVNGQANRYRPGWTNALREQALRWQRKENLEAEQQARNEIATALRNRFENEQYMSALDSGSGAVTELSKIDRGAAAVALAVIHGVAPLSDQAFLSNKTNMNGVAAAISILAGINPSTANGLTLQLNKVRTDFENDAGKLRALIEQTKKDAVVAAELVQTTADGHFNTMNADYAKVQTSREDTFQKLKADIDALTLAYETKMQLRGPVRYWEGKARKHKTVRAVMAGVLVIYSFVALIYLHWAFEDAAKHLPSTAGEAISYAAFFKAGAFALVVTSVAFWVGRVLLRIFLSNQHLATDADERMTMA